MSLPLNITELARRLACDQLYINKPLQDFRFIGKGPKARACPRSGAMVLTFQWLLSLFGTSQSHTSDCGRCHGESLQQFLFYPADFDGFHNATVSESMYRVVRQHNVFFFLSLAFILLFTCSQSPKGSRQRGNYHLKETARSGVCSCDNTTERHPVTSYQAVPLPTRRRLRRI